MHVNYRSGFGCFFRIGSGVYSTFIWIWLFHFSLFQFIFPILNSTASSGLNSIAAVTLEDIVKRVHPGLSDERATKISKIIGIYS